MSVAKFFPIIFLLLLAAPLLAGAQAPDCDGPVTDQLCNEIRINGITPGDIPTLIRALLGWFGGIIGTLAIVMIVFSGGQMIVSQGDPSAITRAKTALTYSIVGFVVSIFAFVIVAATQTFIGANEPGGAGIANPLGTTNLRAFVEGRLLTGFLSLLGTLAILMIIVNGFRYVTAGGNDEQVKKAKGGITWAVVGLISVLMAYVIISAVARLFN